MHCHGCACSTFFKPQFECFNAVNKAFAFHLKKFLTYFPGVSPGLLKSELGRCTGQIIHRRFNLKKNTSEYLYAGDLLSCHPQFHILHKKFQALGITFNVPSRKTLNENPTHRPSWPPTLPIKLIPVHAKYSLWTYFWISLVYNPLDTFSLLK